MKLLLTLVVGLILITSTTACRDVLGYPTCTDMAKDTIIVPDTSELSGEWVRSYCAGEWIEP